MKLFRRMAATLGASNNPIKPLQTGAFQAVDRLELYLGTGTDTPPADSDAVPATSSIFEDQVML